MKVGLGALILILGLSGESGRTEELTSIRACGSFFGNFVVRDWRTGDSEAIREFIIATRIELKKATPERLVADLLNMDQYYGVGRGRFVVVVEPTGQVIGTGAISRDSKKVGLCEFKKFYLSETLRHQGLARQIFNELMTTARDLGCQMVVLHTHADPEWRNARMIYEQAGFREDSAFGEGYHLSDAPVHMVLDLRR